MGGVLAKQWVERQQRGEFAEGFLICFRVVQTLDLAGQHLIRGNVNDEFEDPTSAHQFFGMRRQILNTRTNLDTQAGKGCKKGFSVVQKANPLEGEMDPFGEFP